MRWPRKPWQLAQNSCYGSLALEEYHMGLQGQDFRQGETMT